MAEDKPVSREEHEVTVDLYRQRIARLRNALLAVERGATDHTNAALASYALEEDDYLARPDHEHDSEKVNKRHTEVRKILDGMIGRPS